VTSEKGEYSAVNSVVVCVCENGLKKRSDLGVQTRGVSHTDVFLTLNIL
jgi:hypothetical protein